MKKKKGRGRPSKVWEDLQRKITTHVDKDTIRGPINEDLIWHFVVYVESEQSKIIKIRSHIRDRYKKGSVNKLLALAEGSKYVVQNTIRNAHVDAYATDKKSGTIVIQPSTIKI